MAFTDKLDKLKKICGICLAKSDWESIYMHGISECDRHQKKCGQTLKKVNRLKRMIRDEQLIGEGYACYECYLPTMIC